MLRHANAPVVLLIAIGVSIAAAAQTPAQAPAKHHAKHKATKVVAPAAQPAPAPAPEPPRFPADLPAVAPSVAYYNGMLSIDAPNSSLGDVLREVKRLTGVTIEGGNVSDRIVTHLGPGTPNIVLTQLLEGSRFDYIILGSKTDPTAVQRLVLMARSGGTATPAAGGAQPGGTQQPPPRGKVADMQEPSPVANTDGSDDAEDITPQPDLQPVNQNPPPGRDLQQFNPGNQTPGEVQPQPDSNVPQTQQGPGFVPPGYPQPQQPPDQQQPKTPEQMLKELEQMNQRKQQQPQPNQPPTPQP